MLIDRRQSSPLQAKLLEITQTGPLRTVILHIPEKYQPKPGQYLPCQKLSDAPEVLISHLFSIVGQEGLLTLESPPQNWYPGDQIQYLPPKGQGFHLPTSVQRIGLLPFKVSPFRLLTLVKPALTQNAAIILFFDPQQRNEFLSYVPYQVEVVPLTALKDNLDWLDYLALDADLKELKALSNVFDPTPHTFIGQVLLRTAMPCHGVGECGVCSVKTQHGWRLVCKDGPVFSLEEVINVAG